MRVSVKGHKYAVSQVTKNFMQLCNEIQCMSRFKAH